MTRTMTPALWFFLGWIALLLGIDVLFWYGYLPGGTISDSIWHDSQHTPLRWHLFYLGLCLFGYWHFFG